MNLFKIKSVDFTPPHCSFFKILVFVYSTIVYVFTCAILLYNLVFLAKDLVDPEKCRGELEELLSKWHDLPEGSHEEQATTLDAWHKYEQLTSTHSLQLCEQLRMVLEPSIASKLK